MKPFECKGFCLQELAKSHWLAYRGRCLRWNAGVKRLQLLPSRCSPNKRFRSGAYGTTSGLKLITVANERHAFACGNLLYASPCIALKGLWPLLMRSFASASKWSLFRFPSLNPPRVNSYNNRRPLATALASFVFLQVGFKVGPFTLYRVYACYMVLPIHILASKHLGAQRDCKVGQKWGFVDFLNTAAALRRAGSW